MKISRSLKACFLFAAMAMSGTAMSAMTDADWDRATYDWAQIDGYTKVLAGSINEYMKNGANVDVKYDHASWDKFFAYQKAKKRISDRKNENLNDICSSETLQYFYAQGTGLHESWPGNCPKCNEEFAKKVKLVVCAAVTGNVAPSAELVGTTLKVYAALGDDDLAVHNVGHGFRWLDAAVLPFFPALRNYYETR